MQTFTIDESSAALRRLLFVCELPVDRNEIQRLDLGDFATGDSFTIGFDSETTSAVNYNATPATVAASIKSALEGLTGVDASAITCDHVSGNLYDVTFGGNWAALDAPLMTITPTGFTPGTVTERQYGAVAGAPLMGLTFDDAEIQVSQNGAALANSAGTVTEIGYGAYYYEASAGEVDTQGFLLCIVVRNDVAVTYPAGRVIPASGSTLGAPVVRSGTAQGGTLDTITLDSGASAVSNFYRGGVIYLRSGTGAGQFSYPIGYNGTTKVMLVEPAFAVAPDNTTVFDYLPGGFNAFDSVRTNHTTPGTFGGDTIEPVEVAQETAALILVAGAPIDGAILDDLDTRVPAALVSGRMDSNLSAVSDSADALASLLAHLDSIARFTLTSGSTASAINLNTTTGINGGVPPTSNNAFNGKLLVIRSGALRWEAQPISGYNGTTKIITLSSPLTAAPASGVTGVIV